LSEPNANGLIISRDQYPICQRKQCSFQLTQCLKRGQDEMSAIEAVVKGEEVGLLPAGAQAASEPKVRGTILTRSGVLRPS
jgi:hypothetical protein